MALIERLMHTDPDVTRNMSTHEFVSAGFEIVFGDRTRAEIKTYYNMTQEDKDEFDALADTITGNDNAKLKRLYEIERVLMCAEGRMDWYDTEAKVRTRLGI
jgi:hypothetical protein